MPLLDALRRSAPLGCDGLCDSCGEEDDEWGRGVPANVGVDGTEGKGSRGADGRDILSTSLFGENARVIQCEKTCRCW